MYILQGLLLHWIHFTCNCLAIIERSGEDIMYIFRGYFLFHLYSIDTHTCSTKPYPPPCTFLSFSGPLGLDLNRPRICQIQVCCSPQTRQKPLQTTMSTAIQLFRSMDPWWWWPHRSLERQNKRAADSVWRLRMGLVVYCSLEMSSISIFFWMYAIVVKLTASSKNSKSRKKRLLYIQAAQFELFLWAATIMTLKAVSCISLHRHCSKKKKDLLCSRIVCSKATLFKRLLTD